MTIATFQLTLLHSHPTVFLLYADTQVWGLLLYPLHPHSSLTPLQIFICFDTFKRSDKYDLYVVSEMAMKFNN